MEWQSVVSNYTIHLCSSVLLCVFIEYIKCTFRLIAFNRRTFASSHVWKKKEGEIDLIVHTHTHPLENTIIWIGYTIHESMHISLTQRYKLNGKLARKLLI